MTRCIRTLCHPKVKIEENGRKAIFINDDRTEFEIGHIDGCLVSSGIRADFFVNGSDVSVLVELKGCNIDHACNQLFAAVEHENVKPHLKQRIGFLIICSRYPRADTAIQKAMARAKRQFGAKFLVFTNQREVTMSMFQ